MPSPNNPENAALIATDPAYAGTLSDLSATLTELQALASRIADLQKQTLAKEAAILKTILEKLTPLVPLLSEDYEQCYRRGIVILTKVERVQHEDDLVFFSEHRLILYENGLLVRTHRYGQSTDLGQSIDHGQSMDNDHSMDHGRSIEALPFGWENTEEDVLTPEAAITAFGFTDISKGLIKALGDASSMAIRKEELEGRLAALAEVLDALGEANSHS